MLRVILSQERLRCTQSVHDVLRKTRLGPRADVLQCACFGSRLKVLLLLLAGLSKGIEGNVSRQCRRRRMHGGWRAEETISTRAQLHGARALRRAMALRPRGRRHAVSAQARAPCASPGTVPGAARPPCAEPAGRAIFGRAEVDLSDGQCRANCFQRNLELLFWFEILVRYRLDLDKLVTW